MNESRRDRGGSGRLREIEMGWMRKEEEKKGVEYNGGGGGKQGLLLMFSVLL